MRRLQDARATMSLVLSLRVSDICLTREPPRTCLPNRGCEKLPSGAGEGCHRELWLTLATYFGNCKSLRKMHFFGLCKTYLQGLTLVMRLAARMRTVESPSRLGRNGSCAGSSFAGEVLQNSSI